jgi:hypothetical protein
LRTGRGESLRSFAVHLQVGTAGALARNALKALGIESPDFAAFFSRFALIAGEGARGPKIIRCGSIRLMPFVHHLGVLAVNPGYWP